MMRIGDCPKGEDLEKRGILRHKVLGRVRGVVGTWNRNP
jgi:hypothetical protein